MKGTVHIIHKLENQWMFLTYETVNKINIPKRFPFIIGEGEYLDGQEVLGYLVIKDGVEWIKERV